MKQSEEFTNRSIKLNKFTQKQMTYWLYTFSSLLIIYNMKNFKCLFLPFLYSFQVSKSLYMS
jgi:hypothetical protein